MNIYKNKELLDISSLFFKYNIMAKIYGGKGFCRVFY